jgi:SagB-type dehydrogenase family enzyme
MGVVSLEEALRQRRSVRAFIARALTLDEVASLLWAAQGLTHGEGCRAAPSAGGLFPLETYLVSGDMSGLAAGSYRYLAAPHALAPVVRGDRRQAVAAAALDQSWVRSAPASLVITGILERSAHKYGRRAEQYLALEAGCAAQNVALMAVALALGTVFVGAFQEEGVATAVGFGGDERPYAILPVGLPAE